MAGFYSGLSDGLHAGVRTGMLIGKALKDRRTAGRTESLLGMEADISNWTPPELGASTEAIPVTDGTVSPDMDGREAPGQGYSGGTLRQMVEEARTAAASIGDPAVYAESEGRILSSLTRRFQSHMMSGANLLTSDPTGAVEEFARASSYILDGNVPNFNVITAPDGTPIVAHPVKDPKTGQPSTTMLTKDMIDSMLLGSGTMKDFVAGTAKIQTNAAARYNAEVERRVTASGASNSFLDSTRSSIAAAFADITPDTGKTTRTSTRFDPITGDEVEFEEEVPGAAVDPRDLAAARHMASAIIYANVDNPPEELLRGGAEIRSTVAAPMARDLVMTLIDAAAKGDTSDKVPGLTMVGEDEHNINFRYFSGGSSDTFVVPQVVLEGVADMANRIRARRNLPPLGAEGASAGEAPEGAAIPVPGP